MLERIDDYAQYGEYKCLVCGQPLYRNTVTLWQSYDEDGYEVRTFHKECFETLENNEDLETIYNSFETNELMEDMND